MGKVKVGEKRYCMYKGCPRSQRTPNLSKNKHQINTCNGFNYKKYARSKIVFTYVTPLHINNISVRSLMNPNAGD